LGERPSLHNACGVTEWGVAGIMVPVNLRYTPLLCPTTLGCVVARDIRNEATWVGVEIRVRKGGHRVHRTGSIEHKYAGNSLTLFNKITRSLEWCKSGDPIQIACTRRSRSTLRMQYAHTT